VLYYPEGGYVVTNYGNFSHAESGAIFTGTNGLPSLSPDASSAVVFQIISGYNASDVLGQLGIRYFVIYPNVFGVYNLTKITEALNESRGIEIAKGLRYVNVYEVTGARPIIYSNSSSMTLISSSPTEYTVRVDGPSRITLLQSYSPQWVAYANGTELRNQRTIIYGFSFNTWTINGNQTYRVKIIYEPQLAYSEYLGVSLLAFFGSILAAVLFTLKRKKVK